MTDTPDQLRLPLEATPEPDLYTITIATGPILYEENVVRQHQAKTWEDALAFVDALRDTYAGRYEVTWQAEETSADGELFGLAPGGVVYVIRCTPPLPPL